jgi:hypothetical protein
MMMRGLWGVLILMVTTTTTTTTAAARSGLGTLLTANS